jgi:ABC-type sugar transport system ATPase subunit
MTVRPSPRDTELLGRLTGAEVSLGIRPNAFALRGQAGDDNSFSGRVEVVEHLGTEKYAYVQTPDGLLTVRVASEDPVVEGENCVLGVRSERIHFFGPDGKNILTGASVPGSAAVPAASR